jgi:hypothetical protein
MYIWYTARRSWSEVELVETVVLAFGGKNTCGLAGRTVAMAATEVTLLWLPVLMALTSVRPKGGGHSQPGMGGGDVDGGSEVRKERI